MNELHPHHLEAERAILGSLMQRPDLLMGLELDGADLWRDDHRHLLALLRHMRKSGQAIDLVTVPEACVRLGAERFGGVAYVVELVESGAPAALDSYIAQVRADAERRRLMAAASELIERCAAGLDDPAELASTAASAIRAAAGGAASEGTTYGDALAKAMDSISERQDSGRVGLSTGLLALDDLIGGLCPGRLYVLAGRPKMGKSAIQQHIIESVAEAGQGWVVAATMEMRDAELGERSISAGCGVHPDRIRRGDLSPEDWESILSYVERTRDLPVLIIDRPGQSLGDIERAAHRQRAAGGLSMVAIDYLQLMKREGDNNVRAKFPSCSSRSCLERSSSGQTRRRCCPTFASRERSSKTQTASCSYCGLGTTTPARGKTSSRSLWRRSGTARQGARDSPGVPDKFRR